MMRCKICGTAIPDGSPVCPICGHTDKPGAAPSPSPDDATAAEFFSTILASTPADTPPPPPPQDAQAPALDEVALAEGDPVVALQRKPSRVGLYVGLGVAAVALLVGLAFFLARVLAPKQPVFWISGPQLLYAPQAGAEPIILTDKLDFAVDLALSENGAYAYFFTGPFLYRAELGKLKAGSGQNQDYITLVQSGIRSPLPMHKTGTLSSLGNGFCIDFYLTKDGQRAYFLADINGETYLQVSDGTHTETLEAGVTSFCFSEDGSRLIHRQDGAAFLRDAAPSAEPILLSQDAFTLMQVNHDFSDLYYISGRDMYDGSDPFSSIAFPLHANDSSLCHYSRNGVDELASGINRVVYVADRDHYAYTRENTEQPRYSLYLHSGGEDKLICNQLSSDWVSYKDGLCLYTRYVDGSAPDGTPLVQYACADLSGELAVLQEDFGHPPLLSSSNDIYALGADQTLLHYTRERNFSDPQKVADHVINLFFMSSANDVFFVTHSASESNTYDLYAIEDQTPIQVASQLDDDSLHARYKDGAVLLSLNWDGTCYSRCSYSPAQGQPILLGQRVAQNCRLAGDRFLVLSDYDGASGSLYLCDGAERTLIAEGVSDFYCFGDERPVSSFGGNLPVSHFP